MYLPKAGYAVTRRVQHKKTSSVSRLNKITGSTTTTTTTICLKILNSYSRFFIKYDSQKKCLLSRMLLVTKIFIIPLYCSLHLDNVIFFFLQKK